MEPASGKGGGSKRYGYSGPQWDDMTLYMGYVNFAPSKDLKLGFGVYAIQDDTAKYLVAGQLPGGATGAPNTALNGAMAVGQVVEPNTKLIYTFPVDFAANVGPVALSGFALYQFGTVDFTTARADIDISAFAADLRADVALGPGKFFAEGIVLSGGDNSNDEYQSGTEMIADDCVTLAV